MESFIAYLVIEKNKRRNALLMDSSVKIFWEKSVAKKFLETKWGGLEIIKVKISEANDAGK